tara:strand:+ start:255 stop:923 length:669 start_codon:yes stop_codon:yes gene_type:complete
MHFTLKKLEFVRNKINEIIIAKQLKTEPKIIVITKTFSAEKITPLLKYGHIHYGENKIQEAEKKWKELNQKFNNHKLHMVGKLQSNKAKKAVEIFDYIHSLDNEKLASKISQYQEELNKKIKLFIQINLADENHKSGLSINNLKNFYSYCVNDLSLNVVGFMCLPPINVNPEKYFKQLNKISKDFNLNELSMGMSSDFESAIMNGSTFLRLGTIIMGNRNSI